MSSGQEDKFEDLCHQAVRPGAGRAFGLSLLVVALVYATLACAFARDHAFWSGDSGARFAMVRNWLDYGSLTRLHYADAAADPQGRLNPLSLYAAPGPKGFFVIYAPLFPLLSGLLYRAFGFGGLLFLPLLGGLGAVWVTGTLARRLGLRCWPALPLALGLATPLVVYSVVFWDHSLLMLLAAATGWGMLRYAETGRRRDAALAGAMLGGGVWLHDLFLLLFLAVALTAWGLTRQFRWGRFLSGLLAGFLPLLALWVFANQCLYGTFAGPHLAGGARLVSHGQGFGVLQALDPAQFAQRATLQLVGTEVPGLWELCLLVMLLGVAFAARRGGQAWTPAAFCAAATVLALGLVRPAVPLSGLFVCAPLLAPALAAPWSLPRRAKADPPSPPPLQVFLAWIARTCGVFSLLVLINPVKPGMDWGGRYLLTVLPFLALLSAYTLERWSEAAPGPWRRTAVVGSAALVASGLLCQGCGLTAVRDDLRYSQQLNRRAQALGGSLLVTDVFWLGSELTASRLPQAQLLAQTAQDRLLLLSALDRLRPPAFGYIGSSSGLALLTRAAAHGAVSYAPAASWTDLGLQFARFGRHPSSTVPVPRRVLALYYAWYGTPGRSGRWLHQDRVDATRRTMADHAHFPASGAYDSTDPAVIDRHLRQARAAGVDTLACSWWGRDDRTDLATRLLLARAPAYGMSVCLYWERLDRPGDPRAASEEMQYVLGTLATRPGYLHQNGRPVVFLGPAACAGLSRDVWAGVLTEARRHQPGVLTVGCGLAADDLLLWDGVHSLGTVEPMTGRDLAACVRIQRDTYAESNAAARRIADVCVETVSPGYDDRKVRDSDGGSVVDRRDGRLYRALWERAISDGPDWVLVNSFNEWHNGTEIEPSVEIGDKYLALTRQEAERFRGTRLEPR